MDSPARTDRRRAVLHWLLLLAVTAPAVAVHLYDTWAFEQERQREQRGRMNEAARMLKHATEMEERMLRERHALQQGKREVMREDTDRQRLRLLLGTPEGRREILRRAMLMMRRPRPE